MKLENFLYGVENIVSLKLKEKLSPKCRQAYVALGPTLLTMSIGIIEGYSAIFLPQIQKDDEWNIDTDTESWIASIATLPMPIACLLGGYLMEVIGRRGVHQVDCILNLIGWIILFFSHKTVTVLVGRFITGFSIGLLGAPSPAYLGETSDPNFRGVSLAMLSFAITFGIALSHLLGSFLHWRLIALISCSFPLAAFLCMLFAPESPTFLIKRSKEEACKKAFYWCRGTDANSEKELEILIERQTAINEANKQTTIDWKQFGRPEFVKPLILLTVFFFTLQWSGSNAMTFYTVSILQQSLGGQINEYYSMIFIDLIRVVAAMIALYLQKKVRRRPHSIITILGMLLSLVTVSSAFYANRFYPVVLEKYYVVLLLAFAAYMAFLSLGVNPLPWTMVGELFPLASKGVGGGISACINFAFIFSVVKTTPFLFENLGVDGTFLLYAAVTLFGLIVLSIFLPETKDKPLHEIEDRFKGIK